MSCKSTESSEHNQVEICQIINTSTRASFPDHHAYSIFELQVKCVMIIHFKVGTICIVFYDWLSKFDIHLCNQSKEFLELMLVVNLPSVKTTPYSYTFNHDLCEQ